jgi:hypothetical protein
MNERIEILRAAWVATGLALALLIAAPPTALAARKTCSENDPEYKDTGKRMKCRMENLNDAFDGVVTTALDDDTGAFSDAQKKHLENLKKRSKNETERTSPTDFKHLGKKHQRDTECVIQEIRGDVTQVQDEIGPTTRPGYANGVCDPDEGEVCIGNEDDVCQVDEYVRPKPYKGGCAEALNDGIGDDDGICDPKGQSGSFKEACIEICDADLVLGENDETNVDRGKADEMEQALVDLTDVVDDANGSLVQIVAARRLVAVDAVICDPNLMSSCEYLDCLVQADRFVDPLGLAFSVSTASAAKIVQDACRDALKWDVFVNASSACVAPTLVAEGLNVLATTLEVIDDGETAERLDAMGACVQKTGGEIQEVRALVERLIYLLEQPQGQRFP